MTVCEELRQAVLQAAIQGKITEQREEDGTADELLAEIKAEKDRLIKEGKIKKEKPLPAISEDEIPFDLPESWRWVYLFSVLAVTPSNGKSVKETPSGNVKSLSLSATTSGRFIKEAFKLVEFSDSDKEKYALKKNDILVQRSNSRDYVGTACLYDQEDDEFVYPDLIMRMHTFSCIDPVYVVHALQSPTTRDYYRKNASGTSESMPKINQQTVNKTLISLPPLAEQHRIVAAVNTLMAKIDALQDIETELEAMKTAFPMDMRDAILQAAMQGKLTEQLESDGTAEDLLKEITTEKDLLIKEGKIKKEKALPEISEDEAPFDIPENWKWVRLGDLGQMIGGGTPKTHVDAYWRNGTIPWITPADMNHEDRYISNGRKMITWEGLNNSSAQLFPKGSVIISSRAPIGYIMIAEQDAATSQGCKTFSAYNQDLVLSEFVYYLMYFRTPDLILRASGTTFKEISGKGIGETVIPLPPLAEQHRIVARLNELLPLCDTLEEAR